LAEMTAGRSSGGSGGCGWRNHRNHRGGKYRSGWVRHLCLAAAIFLTASYHRITADIRRTVIIVASARGVADIIGYYSPDRCNAAHHETAVRGGGALSSGCHLSGWLCIAASLKMPLFISV
jgi:hypothetical protein